MLREVEVGTMRRATMSVQCKNGEEFIKRDFPGDLLSHNTNTVCFWDGSDLLIIPIDQTIWVKIHFEDSTDE